MKITLLLTAFFLFIYPAAGQESQPVNKPIAFVLKDSFCYESGIKDLVKAFDILKTKTRDTYCYPTDWAEVTQLQKELNEQGLSTGERTKDEQQLNSLLAQRREYNGSATYRSLEDQYVGKILDEIETSLKKVADENGLMIFDLSRVDAMLLLAIDPKTEVSKQFIKYFNQRSSKNTLSLKLEIPTGKLGMIDTARFFDKINGIKAFINDPSITKDNACEKTNKCTEIGSVINDFAVKNGFILVIDPSRGSPPKMSAEFQDITQKFIDEFNSKHK